MKNSEYTLASLLSDDSFLRWINNIASGTEKKKWQQWMGEKEARENIVKRAKKLADMPFEDYRKDGMVFKELRNLEQKLLEEKDGSE